MPDFLAKHLVLSDRRGFDDERGMVLEIINVVLLHEKYTKLNPEYYLENVKNLKSHDKGRTYEVIKSEIEKLGYIVKEAILNTMDYN